MDVAVAAKTNVTIDLLEKKIVAQGHTRPDVCASVTTTMYLLRYMAEDFRALPLNGFKTNFDGYIELQLKSSYHSKQLLKTTCNFFKDLQESYDDFINLQIIGGKMYE